MLGDEHDLMWRQLLPPPERGSTPLQVQLRTALVTAILDGRLPPGLRMPSSRDLSALWGVSRNTVVLVYERLTDDGYLEPRPRDGYFVCQAVSRAGVASLESPAAPNIPDWTARIAHRQDAFRWLERPFNWQRFRYPFVFGQFDLKLFPLSEWRECARQALSVTAVENWAQDDATGDSGELIDQLIRRVLPRRGSRLLRIRSC